MSGRRGCAFSRQMERWNVMIAYVMRWEMHETNVQQGWNSHGEMFDPHLGEEEKVRVSTESRRVERKLKFGKTLGNWREIQTLTDSKRREESANCTKLFQ